MRYYVTPTRRKAKSHMAEAAVKAPANGAAVTNETGGQAEVKPKSKRGGARAVPDGMVPVKFLMPKEEHAAMTKIAEDDDRNANDFARILARKHVRDHLAKNPQS
jgi:hypothetical protein